MTEKRSHRQTWPMEVDRKITPTNMNGWTWPNFGHIHPLMFVVVIHFRSSSIVHVCRCDLFGHVQIFRSYSFGHVDSVKWLFLIFFTTLQKKKEIDAPNFLHLLANSQLLIYVADAVSTSSRYLCVCHLLFIFYQFTYGSN